MKKPVTGVFTLFLLLTLGWACLARADEVTTWNEIANQVAFDSGLSSTNTATTVTVQNGTSGNTATVTQSKNVPCP